MKHTKDEQGHHISEEDYEMQASPLKGSGHQLSSYRPHDKKLKAAFVKWVAKRFVWNYETYGRDTNSCHLRLDPLSWER